MKSIDSQALSVQKPRPPVLLASRLPHSFLLEVFSYLKLRDVAACMRVCTRWNAVLAAEVREVKETVKWCGREMVN